MTPENRRQSLTLVSDRSDRCEVRLREQRHVAHPPGLRGEGYAELHCRTNFSFLRGASHPEELVARAAELGYEALAVTDRNSLAGVVRMHRAAREHNLKLIIGAEITPVDAPPIALYAPTRTAYGRLCRLITEGRRRARKGECLLRFEDIAELDREWIGIVFPVPGRRCDFESVSGAYRDVFGERLYLGAETGYGADDARRLAGLAEFSRRTGVPLVAANDVHYHVPERRFLQDVLTCIRKHCTLETAGARLFANAERHLKAPREMARLFAAYPRAIRHTVEIARRCAFRLDELRYEYPQEICPAGRTPTEYLSELTWQGARRRFPNGVTPRVRAQIEHELALIAELGYEPYFLTVWDIVRFARSRGILCQGRGSAANSAVCYCLEITAVDPDRIDVLFERFVSRERNEPPDIDVDFEHERREEVFQYIYNKYGRDRAGIVAEVITYRPRSAVREVGKALGLSPDRVDRLARAHEWWDRTPAAEDRLREAGLNPNDYSVRCLRRLVEQILRFPRHLSQHVGGFVITRGPLCEVVPIENAAMPDRTFIEWDKDDIDALGMLKVDCLALGMLTAIRKCLALINEGPREGGTKGARDRGIEGRREEGREGPRDQGIKGPRGGGTEGRRGGGEASGYRERSCSHENDASLQGNENNVWNQHVSGSDRLAEGNRTGQAGLPPYSEISGLGTIRPDHTDATSRGVDPIEYRRGLCPRHPPGVHTIPSYCPRLTSRTSDTVDSGRTVELHEANTSHQQLGSGDGSCSAGSPSQHRTKETVASYSSLSSLGPSVPRSLHPFFPPSLGPSVPPSLLSSVPRSLDPLIPRSLGPSVPPSLALHTIPPEDPAVYDMISRADTVGVFQIESRAQMSMLPRLRPRNFYDLVIEVAIVRPGPIQGKMVHPYLRRRNGEEPVVYPTPEIEAVLAKTLGVPLFQEQAIRLAVVAAGFTPGEADQLRRTMGAWGRTGSIERFQRRLVDGMMARGLSREFAEHVFEQIAGFSGYGFPESHAASFALLVYVSAWLKRYHPAAFTAAILNSQPMGFYAPAQLVRDARQHGVQVRPVDVNWSGYDCGLEDTKAREHEGREGSKDRGIEGPGERGPALRLGMRLVKGISRENVAGIEPARRGGPFTSVLDVWRRAGVSRAVLARLAAADAFRSLGLDRRQALWQVLAIDEDLPLFVGLVPEEPNPLLPALPIEQQVVQDYEAIGLSLTAHPIGLLRSGLRHEGVFSAEQLAGARHGQNVKVAGLVLVRQRPLTAGGTVFITLEDETGIANLVVRPAIFERDRRAARSAIALIAEGRVEQQGQVVHVQTHRLRELCESPGRLRRMSRDFH